MTTDGSQAHLFSDLDDFDLTRRLLADLHDDLRYKVARARQLTDLTAALGPSGTMLYGGEVTLAVWREAQWCFIHGLDVGTVMLCQGLMEHLLAAFLEGTQLSENLPPRISFADTLQRCGAMGVFSQTDEGDLRRLMTLRNPLSHFRSLNDPSSLSARVLDTMQAPGKHLSRDANFAIGLAVRILALPSFRLG